MSEYILADDELLVITGVHGGQEFDLVRGLLPGLLRGCDITNPGNLRFPQFASD